MSIKEIGEDFLSIKEFAELIGMTVVALRHYDKTGIFLPAKRGIEFKNKYRYYSPTQITSAKMIRVLTEIGVPLKTVKELTQHRTAVNTRGRFSCVPSLLVLSSSLVITMNTN